MPLTQLHTADAPSYVTALNDRHHRSRDEIRLSAQEEDFVAAGLRLGGPLLPRLWSYWVSKERPSYGELSAPLSPHVARLAVVGLSLLRFKLTRALRKKDLDEDQGDDLVNDLHSVQLTLDYLSGRQ